MGVVYKARDTKLNRTVALKFLPAHVGASGTDIKRFINEAQAASALDHPNICTIYSIEESDNGTLFIAMAHYKGGSLKEKIEKGPLPLKDVISYCTQIIEGLTTAHEKGIVHRDLKPDNIFITKDGKVKIIDFGLAKAAQGTLITQEGSTQGTAAYMSPEQAQGETVDRRTDIWSLGIVMYEMITGQRPFKSEYTTALMYSIVNERPEPVTGVRTGVPRSLEQIVDKCLEKDSPERYQHADEISADLRRAEKEITSGIRTPVSSEPSPDTDRHTTQHVRDGGGGRNRFIKPALIGFPLLIVLILAVYIFRPDGTPITRDMNSVAVLPFENLSPDPDDAYFADGVHEDIIVHLSQIGDMHVIARSSVLPFGTGERNLLQIANDLNVTSVLEGNIRRAGDIVRVSVQLIDPHTNQSIWADVYDRDLIDIFAIQSEIAREIAGALEVRMTTEEERAIEQTYTRDLEAYRLYVQGRVLWNQRTEDGLRRSVEYFRQAIEQDSTYALAWAGLADAFSTFDFYNIPYESEMDAEYAARKALELNPGLGEAHTSLGIAYSLRQEGPEALRELDRAIELLPSYAEAYLWKGWMQLIMGQPNEGLESLKQAVSLNPLAPAVRAYLSEGYLAVGRYHEALREAQRAREIQPGYALAQFMEALALYHLGRYPEAEAALRETIPLVHRGGTPAPPEVWALLAVTNLQSGDTAGVQQLLARIEEAGHAFSAGFVYAALGDDDAAFETFKSVSNWDTFSTEYIRYFFPEILGRLRDDSRFADILREVDRSWGVQAGTVR